MDIVHSHMENLEITRNFIDVIKNKKNTNSCTFLKWIYIYLVMLN